MHSQHLIKNFCSLATTKKRKDALAIIEAGISAVDTRAALRQILTRSGSRLRVARRVYDLRRYDSVYVIGIGKASYDAAVEMEAILGPYIKGGIIIDVKRGPLKRLKSVSGTHPFPSLANMRATGEAMAILKYVRSRDLVVVIVSGGGSALLCWPSKVKCEELVMITRALMKKGATIQEINTVRKHLSGIKGGQLAKVAYPATIIGLIFSDVPGDDVGMVASGPTVLDPTTTHDAWRILRKYGGLKSSRISKSDLIETPKDSEFFRRVQNVLVVSSTKATEAMMKKARQLKYRVRLLSTALVGEAREVGEFLARLPRQREAVIAAGETTVTVRGSGRGGRNQELALAALGSLSGDTLLVSCSSDGIDNSPAAGALVDLRVREKAKRLRLNPKAYLKRNDSFTFFQRVGSALHTGVTGVNVSDLMLVLRKGEE